MSKYKRNFLTKVILRLDFAPVEISSIQRSFHKGAVKKMFPNIEKKKVYEGNIAIKMITGEVEQKGRSFPAWCLQDHNDSVRFEISQKYAFLEYSTYKDKKDLVNKTNLVIRPFLEQFGVKSINRIGLRYLNEITLNKGKPLEWETYINSDLLRAINFAKKAQKKLTRVMGSLFIKENGVNMRFEYGIWNKDFPNKVSRKEFILDYDCYSRLIFNPREEDITGEVESYSKNIGQLFEMSITDKFRQLLNKS